MDAMTALALGSGLQSLGRGIRGYQEGQEEKRRYDDAAKARKDEADEARRFRAEQARMTREMQREQRRQAAMTRLQEFFGKQGVVLEPGKLRQLADADEQADYAPPGTTDDMIAAATGAESTVPTGDELARSPVANGYTPAQTRISDAAMRALEKSRAQRGARVPLDEDLGFARDEDAFDAARRADEQKAALAMQRLIAGMRYGEDGAAQRTSGTKDALTRVERQIDDTRSDMGQVRLQMPRESEYRDPFTRELDTSGLAGARAPFGGRLKELEARSDSLGGVRDSLVSELQGRPFRRPTTPVTPSRMDPAQMAAMKRELEELAQEAAAILNDPRATEEERAEARSLLEQGQTAVVRRYQGGSLGRGPGG